MVQTTETPTASGRQGLLRRFLVRAERGRDRPQRDSDRVSVGPPVIDIRDDPPATLWRMAVTERLARLDTGMFLVAQTMKRAFADVYGSLEDLRRGDLPGEHIQRVLDESLSSLKAAVEELAESVHRVPYVLAAAADDIASTIERSSPQQGSESAPHQPGPPSEGSDGPGEILPPTPFELEPVEEQFAPMDDDPGDFDARKIWGLEA